MASFIPSRAYSRWTTPHMGWIRFATKGRFEESDFKLIQDFNTLSTKRVALCELFIWSRYDDMPKIIATLNDPLLNALWWYDPSSKFLPVFLNCALTQKYPPNAKTHRFIQIYGRLYDVSRYAMKAVAEALVAFPAELARCKNILYRDGMLTRFASAFPDEHPLKLLFEVKATYCWRSDEEARAMMKALQEDIQTYFASL